MTAQAFYRTVMKASGDERRTAKRATAAVFHALRDRLTMEESDQVVDQLPADLKAIWREGEKTDRRPLKLHREEFFDRVRDEIGLPSRREARGMTLAAFAALKEQLSPGDGGRAGPAPERPQVRVGRSAGYAPDMVVADTTDSTHGLDDPRLAIAVALAREGGA
jgi:uncharacterized protein (DUF2267 family)